MGVVADPTPRVRTGTYERDGGRCIRCGSTAPLSYQHRQAVGMGGSPHRPTWAEGVTACIFCNGRFEHDLQDEALRRGWKVKRRIGHHRPEHVPVFDGVVRVWFELAADAPLRRPITLQRAEQMMRDVYGEEWPDG